METTPRYRKNFIHFSTAAARLHPSPENRRVRPTAAALIPRRLLNAGSSCGRIFRDEQTIHSHLFAAWLRLFADSARL
jgi:hypothetical protein